MWKLITHACDGEYTTLISEELSSVETSAISKRSNDEGWVSEELSSVETVLYQHIVKNIFGVSEELSSVETGMKRNTIWRNLSFRRT